MANVNNPHGFRPLMRSITGGPGASAMAAHKIVGISAHSIFVGDAVVVTGSGTKSSVAISAAAAAGAIYGVNLIYGALSTATDHIIIPGFEQLFEAQIDTVTAAQLFQNAALVATDGSTSTKLSAMSLGSIATTNTLALRLMGLFQSPDNAVGAYAKVIVTLNKNQMNGLDQVAGV